MNFLDYLLLACVAITSVCLIILTMTGANRNKMTGKILIDIPVSKGIRMIGIFLGALMVLLVILFGVEFYQGENDSMSSAFLIFVNFINIYNFTNKVVVTSDGIGKKDIFNNMKAFYKWSDIVDHKWIGDTQLQLKIKNKKGKEVPVGLVIAEEYKQDISSILLDNYV